MWYPLHSDTASLQSKSHAITWVHVTPRQWTIFYKICITHSLRQQFALRSQLYGTLQRAVIGSQFSACLLLSPSRSAARTLPKNCSLNDIVHISQGFTSSQDVYHLERSSRHASSTRNIIHLASARATWDSTSPMWSKGVSRCLLGGMNGVDGGCVC